MTVLVMTKRGDLDPETHTEGGHCGSVGTRVTQQEPRDAGEHPEIRRSWERGLRRTLLQRKQPAVTRVWTCSLQNSQELDVCYFSHPFCDGPSELRQSSTIVLEGTRCKHTHLSCKTGVQSTREEHVKSGWALKFRGGRWVPQTRKISAEKGGVQTQP